MMLTRVMLVPALIATTSAAACKGDEPDTSASAMPAPSRTPTYTVEVVRALPHDVGSFTEGLLFHEGRFFESTGEVGRSYIRELDLETGRVIRQKDLVGTDAQGEGYFGEGIIITGDNLIQLTWKSGDAFIYDWKTFAPKGKFRYDGEGWGMTKDSTSIIMSNGSSIIAFRDPKTFEVKRTIDVHDHGLPIKDLNELELIKGEIWANVYQSHQIVRINPANGEVLGWIDLTDILPSDQRTGKEDVLNGIAYDEANDRIYVTGKFWPKLFEIKVKQRS